MHASGLGERADCFCFFLALPPFDFLGAGGEGRVSGGSL